MYKNLTAMAGTQHNQGNADQISLFSSLASRPIHRRPGTFPFILLPLEIRLTIYRFALGLTCPMIRPKNSRNFLGYRARTHPFVLGLLLVDCELVAEGERVFYESNNFVFELPGGWKGGASDNKFEPLQLPSNRSLRLIRVLRIEVELLRGRCRNKSKTAAGYGSFDRTLRSLVAALMSDGSEPHKLKQLGVHFTNRDIPCYYLRDADTRRSLVNRDYHCLKPLYGLSGVQLATIKGVISRDVREALEDVVTRPCCHWSSANGPGKKHKGVKPVTEAKQANGVNKQKRR